MVLLVLNVASSFKSIAKSVSSSDEDDIAIIYLYFIKIMMNNLPFVRNSKTIKCDKCKVGKNGKFLNSYVTFRSQTLRGNPWGKLPDEI